MADNIDAPVPDGTPPEDFDAFDVEVVFKHLLGSQPTNPIPTDSLRWHPPKFRAEHPDQWKEDRTGLEYFHRGLARRLGKEGGTKGAARSIRRALEDGHLRAVVIDDRTGIAHQIPPHLWMAAATGAKMYWTGRFEVEGVFGGISGDIYLTSAPEPQAAETPDIKTADLSTREKNNLLRAVLGMAMAGYKYDPAAYRNEAVPEIVEDLRARGLAVGADTIRKWLSEAIENVYDQAKDTTREA